MMAIRDAHSHLRSQCKNLDVDKISPQSHTFYSMHKSIQSEVYRDAMMAICKRFQFARPLTLTILKEHSHQIECAKSGIEVRVHAIHDTAWTKKMRQKISSASKLRCQTTDPVLLAVGDMIKHEVHINAMFEMCQKYGVPAQIVVEYVLDWYIKSSHQEVVECRG